MAKRVSMQRDKEQAEDLSRFEIKLVWKDRKRFLGMPLSFTRYSVSDDRLFLETGLLNPAPTRCFYTGCRISA